MKPESNRYTRIIEEIFRKRYRPGAHEVSFVRKDIDDAAKVLKIVLPKNFGDVVYSFRYRSNLPRSITSKAPKGLEWIIRPKGRGVYAFVATDLTMIVPNKGMVEIKIPDATPGIISRYALTDEQALLAKLRYNRLVDIFSGITCYSLQSHLRTSVKDMGQVETDEIYIGLDRRGAHYVFPVQAKGGKDKLGIVQIEQDFAICASKFQSLICRPIAAQFMKEDVIALFEFEESSKGIAIATEKHYRLVPPDELTEEELKSYQLRTS